MRRKLFISTVFFILSCPIIDLMTPLIHLVTLWKGLDPKLAHTGFKYQTKYKVLKYTA